MAAIRTTKSTDPMPQYHVTDAHGNHAVLQSLVGTGNVTLGTASAYVVLSRQNAVDLLVAFTAYANTGVIT